MLRRTLKICGGALLFLSLALPELILPAGAVPIAQPALILSGQVQMGQGVIPAGYRRHWRRGYGNRYYGYRRHYWNSPGIYLNFGLPLAYYGGYGGYYGGYGSYYGGYPRYGRAYRGGGHVAWCRNRYRSYNARTDTFRGNDGRRHRCRVR